jgi:hypothetical protein
VAPAQKDASGAEFPLGRLLSRNIRVWTEEEIDVRIRERPVKSAAPLRGAPNLRRERRLQRELEAAAAAENSTKA